VTLLGGGIDVYLGLYAFLDWIPYPIFRFSSYHREVVGFNDFALENGNFLTMLAHTLSISAPPLCDQALLPSLLTIRSKVMSFMIN